MGPNTFKAVEIVGHTHKYTRIQELIVWPCGFLKYAHKSQGGMHLATQDAHLLNWITETYFTADTHKFCQFFIIGFLSFSLFMFYFLFLCLCLFLFLSASPPPARSPSLPAPPLFPDKKFPALDLSSATSHLYIWRFDG